MQALSCVAPGHLEYQEMPKPTLTAGNTILKIKRIGICGTDLHAFEGEQPYFDYPRILGHELAGEIIETSDAGFKNGEPVTIIPYFNCGHCIACRTGRPNCCETLQVCGVHIDGGMRPFLSVPSYAVLHGEGLTPDELALVEPFAIGAHAIKRAAITENEFVLIAGAGPIGLGIAAFARIAGGQPIMTDINPGRLQFCSEQLGMKYLLNSRDNDLTEKLKAITNGDMPTIVIDATGSRKAITQLFQYMAHGAKYILVGLQKEEICFSHPAFHKREATLMSSRNATKQDFEQVIDAIKKRLIDPARYITHHIPFARLRTEFGKLLDPSGAVIKAIVDMD